MNQDRTNEIRSEEVQEILSHSPHWIIRWGLAIFLFGLTVIICLMCFIKYPEKTNARILLTLKTLEIKPGLEKAESKNTKAMHRKDLTGYFLYGIIKLQGNSAGKIKSGEKIIIAFDNFPYNRNGSVEGLVNSVSKTSINGLYYIKILFPDGLLISDRQTSGLKPRMFGNAMLLSQKGSMLDKISNKFINP
ncbi:MAG TPA: hypothetical protein VJY62_21745 [Bacteroidia bacterium]|nr:hypothetical protein [Bacteroidia bacterium]